VFELLCRDAPERCASACGARDTSGFTDCAIALRYGSDGESLQLARALLTRTGTVAGLETRGALRVGHLGTFPVEAAVPVGPYRHHLHWILSSLLEFEELFATVSRAAPQPVLFRTRPRALRFYRTAHVSFPSASASMTGAGTIAYNMHGVLHESRDLVAATLFHEVFHLNDVGHAAWSERTLPEIFEAIRQRCGSEHECYTPFAPDETRTPGGTYYAFDVRTGNVREYAAELALRWYREHREVVFGRRAPHHPFKCMTAENSAAWGLVTNQFFGGTDLVPPCDARGSGSSPSRAAQQLR
jgi:hypothetical protein